MGWRNLHKGSLHGYRKTSKKGAAPNALELDEIWSFVYAKQKNVARAKNPPKGADDVWTWTAICADTKLVPTWQIGDRSLDTALGFTDDRVVGTIGDQKVQLADDDALYLWWQAWWFRGYHERFHAAPPAKPRRRRRSRARS